MSYKIEEAQAKRFERRGLLKYFSKLSLTRKNFGWWILLILLLICLIGWIITWFNPEGSFIDPFIWIMDQFLILFLGSPFDDLTYEICIYNMCFPLDFRLPIILRGLADGAVLTVIISFISVCLGFILAAILAVILVTANPDKQSHWGVKLFSWIVKFIAQAYVDFFRSTPLLVQILLVYFGIPSMFPNFNVIFRNTEIIAGTIALSLNTAAYQAEIIRGGILSIPTGQTEASRALGLSSLQTMQYVILPQAFRMILPPLTNELVNVILNSSLISSVGVWDLTKWSQSLQAFYFLWIIFFIAAIYYFIITFSLSKLAKIIEVKYRIPGLGVPMSEIPVIEVKNLVKKFGKFEAIKEPGVSFKIMPKEALVIIGSSGSGKSTLLRCMTRLIEPTSGQVFFEGKEITDRSADIDEIRKNIGMVFQLFNLFMHLKVGDNIRLPLKKVLKLPNDEIEGRVEAVLQAVNLSDKINSYPGELSGGQQQRAAIARVLAMRPKLVLFDEPTSALDPELTGEVLETMKRLVKEFHYTLIVVTHEIPFAREIASRVIFMDEGEIIYRGSPGTVFDRPPNERLQRFLSKIIETDKSETPTKKKKIMSAAIDKNQILEKIEKMLSVSKRIKLDMMRETLKLDNYEFVEQIWEWAVQYKFIIDGDYVIVENADIEGFIRELDNKFENWFKKGKL